MVSGPAKSTRIGISLAVVVSSFVIRYLHHVHGLSLSAERAVRPSRPSCPPSGVLPSGGQTNWKDLAALRLPRRSPVARAADVRLPAEIVGEDSAARLVVKAKHCVWR